MNLNKNDYRILDKIYDGGGRAVMCSLTLEKIAELSGLSIHKIRASIKLFIGLGFVNEGARDSRAKTYFLSDKGISIVKENQRISREIAKDLFNKENRED